jgi:xanthine dehydrogenase small subunit
MPLCVMVNGREVSVSSAPPHLSLLAWLRSQGWMGAKEGCAEGECGACAVGLGTRGPDGVTRYEAVNSCLVPLATLHERAVLSVEGVAGAGTLHPVQEALIEHGASQCGYCTPGFVVSLVCAYHADDASLADPETLAGNLCRCTGYRPIRDAQAALAASPRVVRALPQLSPVRDHSAALPSVHSPHTLAEALALRASDPEATVIAGGTDLMVYANQRGTRFTRLLSLERVAELRTLARTESALVIGAALPLSALAHAELPELPVLHSWLSLFASPLVRRRATLGGSLITASPIGDAAPLLLALDARGVLASTRGTRSLPLDALFVGYRQSALAADELLTELHIPLPTAPVQRFYKVAKRQQDDISSVAAAFALELDPDGRVVRFRAAYGGIAATPVRAIEAEQVALGRPWDAATHERVREALRGLGTPLSDARASAAYRRAMVTALFDKWVAEVTP